MNRRAQLACAWCGPALGVLYFIGAMVMARVMPPWISADDTAQQVADMYVAHTDRIRIGMVLMIISMALIGPWGVSMAAQVRRREGAFPILTYVQLTSIGAGVAVVLATCVMWMTAAFRPDTIDPEITQMCHTAGWFFFLCTWPTFTVWNIALGAAILMDPDEGAVYPRWSGFLSIWAGLLYAPGALLIFFKHGAMSWTGLIGMWTPAVAFFAWLAVMCVLTLRNINRGLVYDPEQPATEQPSAGAVPAFESAGHLGQPERP